MSEVRQLITWMRTAALAVAVLLAVPATARSQAAAETGEDRAAATSSSKAPANKAVYQQARAYRGTKITISTNERRLRLIAGTDTLLDVPIGIGMNKDFSYEGK